jgi:hypothetical protein
MSRADGGLRVPAGTDAYLRDPALCFAAAMSTLARRTTTLDDACRAAFAHWMQAAAKLVVNRGDPPTFTSLQSQIFHQTGRWRLGLVRLGSGAVVPLHDHPRAFGLSLLLAGTLDVSTYEIVDSPAGRYCRLRRAWNRELISGELTIMDPWRVNLHRLCAGRQGAVVMTALLSVEGALSERSWYVNLREVDDGELAAVKVANAEMETLQRLRAQIRSGRTESSAA